MRARRFTLFCLPFALLVAGARETRAYSVLTHEAIIDSLWDPAIRPLLLKRFPASTPDQLLKAHAYAYGGCIIQDMGYYPLGSKLFSDLVHYVRSGDFVKALIAESQDLDEYAFAIGALAHFAADNDGHPLGVNPSVPLMYPKLRRKYGDVVTYAQDPPAHIKTEFSFDVLQVARGSYAPQSYHDFIGFEVAKPVLEKAFADTYGLDIGTIFKSLDLALGTYRRTVSSIIPEMTKVAWQSKKDDIIKASPGMTRRKFEYYLSRASYEKEWDGKYERPGIGARFLAFLFRILPKVGPLRALAFKPPTKRTAQLFMISFNRTVENYSRFLRQAGAGRLDLPNLDFDTGQLAHAGEYTLADGAFSQWIERLADHDFHGATPQIRSILLAFYSDLDAPIATKKKSKEWRKTLAALDKLKQFHGAETE